MSRTSKKAYATYSNQGKNMRPSQTKSLLALAAALVVSAVAAADWAPVAAVNGERIELDQSRVTRQGGGKTSAWSRIALERDFIDEYGMRYTAIEALNRYDCEKHSLTTVKRVYRRDGKLVREETVAAPRELAVVAGSADAKLLAEACKARSVGAAQQVGETAPRLADEAREGRPSVMYADMRTAESVAAAKPRQVADKPAEAKPAEQPNGNLADKPAETRSNERPRYIDLPKIDKSQFDEPAKGAAAKPVDPKSAARPAAMTAEKPAASRHELERQYATTGPRKAAKSKAAEPVAVAEHRSIHWGYEGEGAPANWGKLRSDYATCAAGRRQSPIDIRDGIKVDLEPIQFDYKLSSFAIIDNGHTVQVRVGEGSSIHIMERQYDLVQFHFHKPSEERIGGHAFDMVVHLVHQDYDGRVAVIAVLLEKGSEHPLIQALWNNLPLDRDQEVAPAMVIDPNLLLPPKERRAYYTYMGSLTTPPCTEGVLWMVFKQPVPVSPQQISIFSRLYSHNARPVQPTNGRLIKENR